tara:strand:- start:550 stop:918 length:369 start_codon:yes stop_codon:yes gene_type:complete
MSNIWEYCDEPFNFTVEVTVSGRFYVDLEGLSHYNYDIEEYVQNESHEMEVEDVCVDRVESDMVSNNQYQEQRRLVREKNLTIEKLQTKITVLENKLYVDTELENKLKTSVEDAEPHKGGDN